MGKETYAEMLTNPLWQRKRLEIMQRDNFTCQICLDTEEQLQVHHKSYDKGKKAWEYGNDRLITICASCHDAITKHIKTHGHDKQFSVLKIKREGFKPLSVIYSCGSIMFSVPIDGLLESSTHKLVQFLINNWLKDE